jgi:phytoene dehydrogenase-like protein
MKPQQGSENHPTSSHSPNHDPAASRRRPIAIVGGGMAGVSLAWLLDGARDVVLLEARDTVGGNVQSVEVDLEGHRFLVDLGAQYFHPGPYPVYTALLRELDLYDPDSSDGPAHSFPASITQVARSLGVTSPRSERLSAVWNGEGSKRKALVESDSEWVG